VATHALTIYQVYISPKNGNVVKLANLNKDLGILGAFKMAIHDSKQDGKKNQS